MLISNFNGKRNQRSAHVWGLSVHMLSQIAKSLHQGQFFDLKQLERYKNFSLGFLVEGKEEVNVGGITCNKTYSKVIPIDINYKKFIDQAINIVIYHNHSSDNDGIPDILKVKKIIVITCEAHITTWDAFRDHMIARSANHLGKEVIEVEEIKKPTLSTFATFADKAITKKDGSLDLNNVDW